MVGAEPRRLPPLHRVLFVIEGEPCVATQSGEQSVATGHAWYGHEPCALRAVDANARVLRFELYRDHPPALDGGMLNLAHSIDLDPGAAWLMRCDRVDFEPAGEAPLHRHRGGGIRRLLRGAIEPVYAAAAPDEETSFIRVTLQPAEIRGRSSIMYVNPAEATRKPRSYHVFIDEPIQVR
jgi:hypothetical protein